MRLVKFLTVFGFGIGLIGFLVIAVGGEHSVGKVMFLVGFLFIVLGIVSNVFLGQLGWLRGTGLRIAAAGFLLGALGALTSFVSPSIATIGGKFIDVGFFIMLAGLVFHMVGVVRSKKNL